MHNQNLSEARFLSVAKKMLILEYKMSQILYRLGWLLPAPIAKTSRLFIVFEKTDKIFNGEICVKFDDHPRQTRFTFYVTKSFDEDNFRYSLKNNLLGNKGYSAFESKISELIEMALKKYNNWDKDDIMEFGKKEKLK